MNAKAFTFGKNIYFNKGYYNPSSFSGKYLLAHELTHVAQQYKEGGVGLNRMINSLPFQIRKEQIKHDEFASESGESHGEIGAFFNLSGIESVRANMETRFLKCAAYASLGLHTGDIVRSKLLGLSSKYDRAYNNHARVVKAAREEAQNQEQWINICVGIGAGVLLGLAAAFVFPTSAAGWMAISAGEAIGAMGSAAGQAVAGAFITSKVTDALSVPGTDLEPLGLDPNILKLRIWKNVSKMYRSAISLNSASTIIHMLGNAAEFLIGEIRVHIAGGKTYMSQDSVFDMVEILVNADNALSRFDELLSKSLENVGRLRTGAESISLNDYPQREMEQDIWILWISELDDPSILDLDEIEDYLHDQVKIGVLGSSGILGVDFGIWTSSEDEARAQLAARQYAGSIRDRLSIIEGSSL